MKNLCVKCWCSFNMRRSQECKCKFTVFDCIFCAFGICLHKSCSLVQLTPGVYFNNMFTRCFYACRSWKHKNGLMTWLSFFALSGSGCVKAACWWKWSLVSISTTFYKQLFQKSFAQHFSTYNLVFLFFGKRKWLQKLLIKCWWNRLQVSISKQSNRFSIQKALQLWKILLSFETI